MAPVEDTPRALVPVGNTVRMGGAAAPPDVALVLVVGATLTSHFWLNILPLATEPRMRYYVTEGDLRAVVDRLHVRPTCVPAFLVLRDGYPVDWMPAPLPPPGQVADPAELVARVRDRIAHYRSPTQGPASG